VFSADPTQATIDGYSWQNCIFQFVCSWCYDILSTSSQTI